MKQRTVLFFLVAMIAIMAFSGCRRVDQERAEAKLTVTETMWSGRAKDLPVPTVTVFEVFSEGTVLYDNEFGGKVYIEKLTDEKMILRFVDSCFVESNQEGTINILATPLDTVSITRGEEIKVVTATLDAGIYLTIRFE